MLGFDAKDVGRLGTFIKLALQDKFLGSYLGVVWAVMTPLLMLSIFTFVFGFIFRAKLPGAETSLSYVIWLISGYGPWLAVSEGLISATTSVTANSQLIKNLKIKSELLPISGTLLGLIPVFVTVLFMVVLIVLEGRMPHVTWLSVPLILVIQMIFIAGIGLILAGMNVIIRDVSFVLPNILLVVMFASPIFYPLTAYPSIVRPIMQFNPFYVMAEGYRQPLLYNELPPVWMYGYLGVLAVISFCLGLFFYRKVQRYFDSLL